MRQTLQARPRMCNENRQGRAAVEASNAAAPLFHHAQRYSPLRPYGRRGSVSRADRPQCRATRGYGHRVHQRS